MRLQSYATVNTNLNTKLTINTKMLSCLEHIVLLMLQCTYYNEIWWDSTHYHTEAIDWIWYTADSRVIGTFEGEDGQEQE